MIVILTGTDPLADMFIAGISREIKDLVVIREEPMSSKQVDAIRLKKLGYFNLLGIKLAKIPMRIALIITRQHRKKIINALPTDFSVPVHYTPSVNAPETIALLQKLNPEKVAVFGTRIIKQSVLDCIPAPFINYHCGINPKYRGQMPLWWALASGDEENAGVTIHLVDQGLDTGDVLLQERLSLARMDIHATHYYKALPVGVRLMVKALQEELPAYKVDLPSQVFFPPTIWQYLYYGIKSFRF
jgi:folate-dependent phosphoribosylglycinamide formyltransferase PurN